MGTTNERWCYKVAEPIPSNGPLTRYVQLQVAHAPGMPGRSPRHRLKWKPPVSDPGMHHGTCVTHVPWCMSGSLTGGGGENVPGIPGACTTRKFTYLVRGPWPLDDSVEWHMDLLHFDKSKVPFNPFCLSILRVFFASGTWNSLLVVVFCMRCAWSQVSAYSD